ncbi:MAG: hypothetical protein V7L00_20850 [Nostoc sp.]|uniref:hypothetical protein n=1 Tax=Nostoc sp. TaxID=1180 RepID=UPI002FF76789
MHKYLIYPSFERSQNPTLIDSFLIVTFLSRTAKAMSTTGYAYAASHITVVEIMTPVFYK